jgi:hypothetical protein
VIVPPWLDALLDVIGLAGFVGIACFHKGARKKREPTAR